jgi:hypothetical protein
MNRRPVNPISAPFRKIDHPLVQIQIDVGSLDRARRVDQIRRSAAQAIHRPDNGHIEPTTRGIAGPPGIRRGGRCRNRAPRRAGESVILNAILGGPPKRGIRGRAAPCSNRVPCCAPAKAGLGLGLLAFHR